MAIQTINIGTVANDGTGDPLRTAFSKSNSNFTDLDTRVNGKQPVDSDLTAIAALTTTAFGRSLLTQADAAALRGLFNGREVLTAARTYYVSPTGNNNNNGLSAGAPFLTIQKAVDVAALTVDTNGFPVTVNVAAGTHTTGVTLRPLVGGGAGTIIGNETTPANVVISATSAHCVNSIGAREWTVAGLKLLTTASGNGINTEGGGVITHRNCDFGLTAGWHIQAILNGIIQATGPSRVSGGGLGHWNSNGGRIFEAGQTITVDGSFALGGQFCNVSMGGTVALNGATINVTGTVTGSRYYVATNGVILTNGGSQTFLPGSLAGSVLSGGQYV